MQFDDKALQRFDCAGLLNQTSKYIHVVTQDGVEVFSLDRKQANRLLKNNLVVPNCTGNKLGLMLSFPFVKSKNRSKDFCEIFSMSKLPTIYFEFLSYDEQRSKKVPANEAYWLLASQLAKPYLENVFKFDIPYYLHKENGERPRLCVNCGIRARNHAKMTKSQISLTRHHIVPKAYLAHFPIGTRDLLHDVVFLCNFCHQECEDKLRPFKIRLGEITGYPYTDHVSDTIPHNHNLYTLAKRVVEGNISEFGRGYYIQELKTMLHKQEITDADLEKCLSLEISRRIDGPTHYEGVVNYYQNELEDLRCRFRRFFVDSVNPMFLPLDFEVCFDH